MTKFLFNLIKIIESKYFFLLFIFFIFFIHILTSFLLYQNDINDIIIYNFKYYLFLF